MTPTVKFAVRAFVKSEDRSGQVEFVYWEDGAYQFEYDTYPEAEAVIYELLKTWKDSAYNVFCVIEKRYSGAVAYGPK